jgi:hypothetical protein
MSMLIHIEAFHSPIFCVGWEEGPWPKYIAHVVS